MSSVMGWLTAWVLMFLLLFVLAKTRSGHTIIYYTAWLLVVLLLVTHSTQITKILQGGGF
jgi:hypothetical protein